MNRRKFYKYSSLATGAYLVGCNQKTETKKNSVLDTFHFDMHSHPGFFFANNEDSQKGNDVVAKRLAEMSSHKIHGFLSLVSDFPLLKVTDNGVEFNGSFEQDEGWLEYKLSLIHI